MDRVTVIIPAYNSARFIVEAVESALRQTIPPARIIVVDDGSTDDTAARLQCYAGRITLIQQKNEGAAAARNAALRIADGEWIAFLDADDVWHPRKLQMQLDCLRARPELGMLGTRTFDYPTQPMPGALAEAGVDEIPLEKLLVRNDIAASSVLIRQSVAARVGGFDVSVRNVEDWDYWQRAAEIAGVANLTVPLTGYRAVPGSVSRRPVGVEIGSRRVLQKLDERGAWRGRGLLRRKAFSQLNYSSAYLYGAAGDQFTAIRKLLQSFFWYPFPFERAETGATLARPRRLAVLLLRLLRLRPPEVPLAGPAIAD